MWRTDLTSPNDSQVQYGTDVGNLNQTATSTAVIPGSNFNVRDHIVNITGLNPARSTSTISARRVEAWKEAVADLEIAAERIPDRASIHAALAKAYEQLGDANLSKKHRELSDQSDATDVN